MAVVEIVYATKTGCAGDVASSLSAGLSALGHKVELAPAGSAAEPRGDAVVVVSGVRAGHLHRPVLNWAKRHTAALTARPLAVITVCLEVLSDESKAQATAESSLRPVGLTPALAIPLPGRLFLTEYGLLERQLMRKISRDSGMAEGDYRDQERERSAAARIAALLPPPGDGPEAPEPDQA